MRNEYTLMHIVLWSILELNTIVVLAVFYANCH